MTALSAILDNVWYGYYNAKAGLPAITFTIVNDKHDHDTENIYPKGTVVIIVYAETKDALDGIVAQIVALDYTNLGDALINRFYYNGDTSDQTVGNFTTTILFNFEKEV